MTLATLAKSWGLASRCTSDATVRIWYGDRLAALPASSSPSCSYCRLLPATRVDRMSCADADGSTFHVPGAISPSMRRWSLPRPLIGSSAHAGVGRADVSSEPAACLRSSALTHCLASLSCTHVASEIRLNTPWVTSLVL